MATLVNGRKARQPKRQQPLVYPAGSDAAIQIVNGFIRQAKRQGELGEAHAAVERLRAGTRRRVL